AAAGLGLDPASGQRRAAVRCARLAALPSRPQSFVRSRLRIGAAVRIIPGGEGRVAPADLVLLPSPLRGHPVSAPGYPQGNRQRHRAAHEHRGHSRWARVDGALRSKAPVRRVVVGAHYGLRDWLAQRISAVIMAAYSVIVVFIVLSSVPLSYETWKE